MCASCSTPCARPAPCWTTTGRPWAGTPARRPGLALRTATRAPGVDASCDIPSDLRTFRARPSAHRGSVRRQPVRNRAAAGHQPQYPVPASAVVALLPSHACLHLYLGGGPKPFSEDLFMKRFASLVLLCASLAQPLWAADNIPCACPPASPHGLPGGVGRRPQLPTHPRRSARPCPSPKARSTSACTAPTSPWNKLSCARVTTACRPRPRPSTATCWTWRSSAPLPPARPSRPSASRV